VTNTTISPFVVGGVQQVELADANGVKKKYWRKEILPSGTRKYKGEELDFSKISPACVKAFDDGAAGAVPFVLALADNSHPKTGQELENLEGDLHKLEMGTEGNLFGYFDLSDEVVTKIRKSNGKLGVSARIDVGYKREDTGQEYDYALRHVCATTAPHIKGLKPWETVDFSDEDKGQVTLDLSNEVIDEVPTKKESGVDLVAVEIPKDQLDRLLAFIGDIDKADAIAAKLTEDDKKETTSLQLSEEANKRIELAEKNARSAIELAQNEAATSRWANQKRELALAGVPPVMLTEAEPIMRLYSAPSIELSEGVTLSASDVIGKILEHAKGTIKLGEESGHGFGEANGSPDEDKELAELEKFFLAQ
jgi:hypothetical protein